jgi:hypothetical protein
MTKDEQMMYKDEMKMKEFKQKLYHFCEHGYELMYNECQNDDNDFTFECLQEMIIDISMKKLYQLMKKTCSFNE